MNKNVRTRILSALLSTSVLFSVLSFSVSAFENNNQAEVKGNVPVTFTPRSEITFKADGSYEVTRVAEPAPESREVGVEIGGNLQDENPEYWEAYNQAVLEKVESLPVYTYEQYYIAKEGAVAQYDQNGELIRVRGDHEYYSTLDQYMVNGVLPDGKYVGTYLEFSQFSEPNPRGLGMERATTKTGKITTYGDKWPSIPTSDTASNADPVPQRGKTDQEHINYYGDRIGTKDNQLKIGDVATRIGDKIPYNTTLTVTIQATDTNGSGSISKDMRVRDVMGATTPILDIWRWDSPDWFSGKAQSPNALYFGQTYTTSRSFSSTKNYFTY